MILSGVCTVVDTPCLFQSVEVGSEWGHVVHGSVRHPGSIHDIRKLYTSSFEYVIFVLIPATSFNISKILQLKQMGWEGNALNR